MALIYKKIFRVYCPLCGWEKEYNHPDDLDVVYGKCPACNDGQGYKWEKLKREKGKSGFKAG
jgi:hypothetical protein